MSTIRMLTTVMAIAWTITAEGRQSPPDFSGRWIAEPEIAAAPGGAAPGAPQGPPPRGSMGSGWGSPIDIKQDAKQLIVEHQMFSRYDLQPPLRHVYALDGSETQYPIMISHTTQVRRSRTVWKGQTLEITTSYPAIDPAGGKPFSVEVTQRLSLESPNTLIVDVTRSGALGGGSTSSRTVYKKG